MHREKVFGEGTLRSRLAAIRSELVAEGKVEQVLQQGHALWKKTGAKLVR